MCLLVVVRMGCFTSSVSIRLPSVNEIGHSSEDFFDNKEFSALCLRVSATRVTFIWDIN